MPHLTIEYSGDLAASRPDGLLSDLPWCVEVQEIDGKTYVKESA